MSTEEKILLVLGGLAIAAVLLFQVKPKTIIEEIAPNESQPVEEPKDNGGPAYLTYNQPYIWGPPVNNFLPPINIA
jgi:hypothetical protein